MIENSAILNRDTKIDQLLIYDKEKVKKPSLTPFLEVENYKRSIVHQQGNIENTDVYPEHFENNKTKIKTNDNDDENNDENSETKYSENMNIFMEPTNV